MINSQAKVDGMWAHYTQLGLSLHGVSIPWDKTNPSRFAGCLS